MYFKNIKMVNIHTDYLIITWLWNQRSSVSCESYNFKTTQFLHQFIENFEDLTISRKKGKKKIIHFLRISKRHQQGKIAYSVAKMGKDKIVPKLPCYAL